MATYNLNKVILQYSDAYLPVCGSDGKTYKNSWEAESLGLVSYRSGACNSTEKVLSKSVSKVKAVPTSIPKVPPPQEECSFCNVPPGYYCVIKKELVCGVDGKTYSHPQLASCAGVAISYPGACKPTTTPTKPSPAPKNTPTKPGQQPTNTQCLQIYKPVCGNNKKTYSNECEAKKAGITNFVTGPCPDVISPQQKSPQPKPPLNNREIITVPEGTKCIQQQQLTTPTSISIPRTVCGKVGESWKTFENVCYAYNKGVVQYRIGPCPKEPDTSSTPTNKPNPQNPPEKSGFPNSGGPYFPGGNGNSGSFCGI